MLQTPKLKEVAMMKGFRKTLNTASTVATSFFRGSAFGFVADSGRKCHLVVGGQRAMRDAKHSGGHSICGIVDTDIGGGESS